MTRGMNASSSGMRFEADEKSLGVAAEASREQGVRFSTFRDIDGHAVIDLAQSEPDSRIHVVRDRFDHAIAERDVQPGKVNGAEFPFTDARLIVEIGRNA